MWLGIPMPARGQNLINEQEGRLQSLCFLSLTRSLLLQVFKTPRLLKSRGNFRPNRSITLLLLDAIPIQLSILLLTFLGFAFGILESMLMLFSLPGVHP